jgi:4-azaleucine resistance transporter AzlC
MPSTTPRSEFLAGIRAELPILLGVIPFGVIYGVVALQAGLSAAAAQGMSAIIFAGSAQFITAQLFAQQTPALVVVLTVFVVNLRHTLYSASVEPYVKHLPGRWKWLLAYLLTDEAYAVIITEYSKEDLTAEGAENAEKRAGERKKYKHYYFLGAGVALWVTWQASTAAGVFLGAQVPDTLGLDFAIAVTFIAIVVPALRDRTLAAAAVSAGLVAVVAAGLPYNLGLVVAALVGITVGLVLEGREG